MAAQLTVHAFDVLGHYANSHGDRAYCHTELAVFFPGSGWNTVTSAHCSYPQRDGQSELT